LSKSSSANNEAYLNQGAGASRPTGINERTASISGETIGQLVRMRNEFADLKKLRERERASSQVLIGALKDALLELDATIPLSKESLMSSFTSVRESWLSPDSTVTVIDSTGTKTSVPLESLPSHTIILALQDCAVKMSELMAQKLDHVARNVDLLERAVFELQNDGKQYEQTPLPVAPQEQVEKPIPQKAEDKGFLSSIDRKLNKRLGKGDGDRFAYSGEFKGKQVTTPNGPQSESNDNRSSTSS
jgi:hypothetical protein